MLSERETVALLRTLLPMMRLPAELGEANIALCIESPVDPLAETDEEVIGARLQSGLLQHAPDAVPIADAWLRGTVLDWLDLLFDRGQRELHTGGAPDLAAACVDGLRGTFSAEGRPQPALVSP